MSINSVLPRVRSFEDPAARVQQSPNRLLNSLPPDEYERVAAGMIIHPLKAREVLQKNGEPISHVYFPYRSVCSITNAMEDGGMVEVATVGREGFVGISAALGDTVAAGDAFVQVQGDGMAQAMTMDAFQREFARKGPFYEAVNRYVKAFMGLIMQSVACNGLHSAEERCCRWLLMTHDRVERDEFPLTHEFLAIMLGVRRPTVTLVLAELQRAGIVAHVRGQVRIVDRAALEATSCECYKSVRALFARLLPE